MELWEKLTDGIGSTEGMDICYCINRRSSGVRRARFAPEEVVWLTLQFYRRNYIEDFSSARESSAGPITPWRKSCAWRVHCA